MSLSTDKKSAESFLQLCQESSQKTYDLFKALTLDEAGAKSLHLPFLQELFELVQNHPLHQQSPEKFQEIYFFHFTKLPLGTPKETLYLKLLHFPSTFAPEEWSFTFFEGLSRYPRSEFEGKTVTELGCGNGWITLALAKKFYPEKIYGLDINPKAVVCAQLNLYLNAVNERGEILLDSQGKNLFERVEFAQSDLLAFARERRLYQDRILGCIPQVLGPDPSVSHSLIGEEESDEYLHSLSNYYQKQGHIEDQFGLGLVARALEEGIELMKSGGKIILNLGGRPGASILDRLFLRRGFNIRKVWERKIHQAADTDISSLVEIEKNSGHRFEFFMSPTSEESLSAHTAQLYQNHHGPIYHALTVYDAVLKYPYTVQKLMRFLNKDVFREIKQALDLDFQSLTVGEEKVHFLAQFAEYLDKVVSFEYGPQEGLSELRQQLATFLKNYYHLPYEGNDVFITSHRSDIITNLQFLHQAPTLFITKDLARYLPPYKERFCKNVIEVPYNSSLIVELAKKLHPQMLIASILPEDGNNFDCFQRLLNLGHDHQMTILLDLSQLIDLSSRPLMRMSGLVEYLNKKPLPPNVYLMCGLIKNQVYKDLELAFVLSKDKKFQVLWKNLADLTYCRTPLIPQFYYSTLIQDLLKFHIVRDEKKKNPKSSSSSHIHHYQESFHPQVVSALTAPLFENEHLELTTETVRMDYGENELKTPDVVKRTILESFLRHHLHPHECDPRPELAEFLKNKFGLTLHAGVEEFYFDHGITPVFSKFMQFLQYKKETLLISQGSYGYFMGMAEFFQVNLEIIPTHENDSFKLSAASLSQFLKNKRQTGPLWLYLNAPLVNPMGVFYSFSEIIQLIEICKLYQVSLVFDTIFFGLEFSHPQITYDRWFLSDAFADSKCHYFLLGGLSKEFACGGIRFGYGVSNLRPLNEFLRSFHHSAPHPTLSYVVKKLYHLYNKNDSALMSDLIEQKSRLQQRAGELTSVLSQSGWKVLNPQGGLFLVASPVQLIGKEMSYHYRQQQKKVVITEENLAMILFEFSDLLINPPHWTQLPHYYRFVLSISEERFRKGLEKIRAFAKKAFFSEN